VKTWRGKKNLTNERKKEEYVRWKCPYCGGTTTAPQTASVYTVCANCGKEYYASGIDVEDRKTKELFREMERRRKREVAADKEHE
jgi:ribosomal protein S27E